MPGSARCYQHRADSGSVVARCGTCVAGYISGLLYLFIVFLVISTVSSVFLYHVMPFSVYPNAAIYPSLSQKAPGWCWWCWVTGTLLVFIALWLNVTSSFCKCALFDWRRFTSIVDDITECRTETDYDMYLWSSLYLLYFSPVGISLWPGTAGC